jgi:hypothetical protein
MLFMKLRKCCKLGSSPLEGEPNRARTIFSFTQSYERDLVGGILRQTPTSSWWQGLAPHQIAHKDLCKNSDAGARAIWLPLKGGATELASHAEFAYEACA